MAVGKPDSGFLFCVLKKSNFLENVQLAEKARGAR
jgi:hypothetical protein